MAGTISPSTIASYAALLLTDDRGVPISPAAHHWLWLQLMCDTNIRKLLIIAPPEAAKTTWAVGAYLSAWVGFYPQSSAIIASVDAETAVKRSMTVRNMIETNTWRALFPDLLPAQGMKFEQGEWSIARQGVPAPGRLHPTMRSYGVGQSIVGSRADLLLGDDLIDYDSARTPGQRTTIAEWFHNSFLSRRKPEGRVIILGTMWNASDLYADLRKSESGFVVCHTPLLSDREDGFYADLTYPIDFEGRMLGDMVCPT